MVRPDDLVKLTRLVRRAALVHLNLSFPAGKYQLAVALLTWLARRPMTVTHHLGLSTHLPWSLFMRWLGRAARRHIVVSNRTRTLLIAEFGYRPERVIVIHNGIDPMRFRPVDEPARRALRQRKGELMQGRPWGDDVLLVCSVARLSPQKGLLELIAATDLIVKRQPNARVVVIGEGQLRPRLEEEVRRRGLGHNLFLAGTLSRQEVANWLDAADLFILPSRYEGGPATALMEAMASGCAVIATDVSGVDELITDGTLGRLVPPQNVEALANAAVELLGDRATRTRLGDSARLRVTESFTIETCMKRTVAVFDELSPRALA